jgi:hypothetical protein
MKKLLLILFTVQCCIQSYAQVNFEKGYFIDNNNIRTECLIKNKDFYNSPNSFEYKLNQEKSIVMVGDVKDIKEVGIINAIKFERHIVKMDMSSTNLNKLSEKSEPEWKERTLFLRVLIEGEATLYEFKEENNKRYFYKLSNKPVEQLIYKKYFVLNFSYTKLAINNDFQKQLWVNMRCENKSMEKIMKLQYNKKDLSDYFVKYNNCKNLEYTNYVGKTTTGSINFKLKGGINASPNENYDNQKQKVEYFGNKFFPKYGAEIEYVSPFNRNKWAIYLELTHQTYKYKSTVTEHSSSGVLFENTYKYDSSVNQFLPNIGLRHYMYLNNNSSVFIGASLFSSYGVGYNYQKKFNIEFRRSSIGFAKYSAILGFTLFNNNKQK